MSKKIEVRAEITGTVWKIVTKVGDKIEAGDNIMIVESMKMEIPVISEDSGVIVEILVDEKSAVSEGQIVAILEE